MRAGDVFTGGAFYGPVKSAVLVAPRLSAHAAPGLELAEPPAHGRARRDLAVHEHGDGRRLQLLHHARRRAHVHWHTGHALGGQRRLDARRALGVRRRVLLELVDGSGDLARHLREHALQRAHARRQALFVVLDAQRARVHLAGTPLAFRGQRRVEHDFGRFRTRRILRARRERRQRRGPVGFAERAFESLGVRRDRRRGGRRGSGEVQTQRAVALEVLEQRAAGLVVVVRAGPVVRLPAPRGKGGGEEAFAARGDGDAGRAVRRAVPVCQARAPRRWPPRGRSARPRAARVQRLVALPGP